MFEAVLPSELVLPWSASTLSFAGAPFFPGAPLMLVLRLKLQGFEAGRGSGVDAEKRVLELFVCCYYGVERDSVLF